MRVELIPEHYSEYPHLVKDLHAEEWEELARREPCFTVLTTDGSMQVDSSAFFATGEADTSTLLSAIASIVGHDVPLTSALDLGCGAGRLTLPLARHATKVVGCDIAPTMLDYARENAKSAGLRNVTFIELDALTALRDGQFDFICSLLVFQYIRPSVGHDILRTLLRLLEPVGLAAFHFMFQSSGAGLRTLARLSQQTSRRRNRKVAAFPRVVHYDEHVVQREIEAAGASVIGRFTTGHGDTSGTVLIVQKAMFNQSES
jgi:SAM-dependent methyltransferase